MNRLQTVLQQKKENILTLYFTAGYPELNDTKRILQALEESGGVDVIEIGMPFSDPLADGDVIQKSSLVALHNGMTLDLLFQQLADLRKITQIPVLLMGYLNPVYKYGIEAFVSKCKACGIDGIIVPDLPVQEYQKQYQSLFEANNFSNVLLITPESSNERIHQIDDINNAFIYMVSSASTTGVKTGGIDVEQEAYFKRVDNLKLKSPRLIGFGISDKSSFDKASKYAQGAIIGSAFIKAIANSDSLEADVKGFVKSIREGAVK